MEKNTKQKRVAIYTRQSNEKGDILVPSCPAQRDRAHFYILSQKEKNWVEIEKKYDDPDYSGKNLKRPGIQQLIHDIENGKVDVVVVYKLNRLTRKRKDFDYLLELFQKYDIELVSISENVDTKTPSGRLMMNVMLDFSQYERETDIEVAKDTRYSRAKKGFWPGGFPPIGYYLKDKLLYIDKKEAKVVRKAFELYPKPGFLSTHKVAKELNRLGYRTKMYKQKGKLCGGKRFDKKYVSRILNNKLYIGIIRAENPRTGKIEEFQGKHKPIIERRLFDQVQKILNKNKGRKKSIGQNKYNLLLLGILKCGACGSSMTAYPRPKTLKDGTKKMYLYYKCRSVLDGDKTECKVRSVPAREIENFVINKLKVMGRDRKVLDNILGRVNREARRAIAPMMKEKSELMKKLQQIKKEDQALINFIKRSGDKLSKKKGDAILNEHLELEKNKEEIEKRIAQIDAEVSVRKRHVIDVDTVAKHLKDFAELIEELEPKEKVRLIQLIVKEVEYHPEKEKIKISIWEWPGSAKIKKLLEKKNPIAGGGGVNSGGVRGAGGSPGRTRTCNLVVTATSRFP